MKRGRLPLPISKYLTERNEHNLAIIANGEKGSWSLSKFAREAITESLLKAQGSLCAYCESRLYNTAAADKRGNLHIEHVRERHDKPELTYSYSNFVLSCHGGMNKFAAFETVVEKNQRVQSISCGHYKTDHFHKGTSIDYTKLLDPFAYNYADYFSYTEELLITKPGLTPRRLIKAAYTLERLNLNADRLQFARLAILRQVRKDLMSYKQKASQKRYITNLIKENQDVYPPFVSLIRHHFSWVLDIN